tara:strand:- start:20751 stop:21482 length:732 start_codon:yes stop_codon:yes gene_type:complete
MTKDIIILAAGIGSRLRPLTDNVPKTMVKVNGEAIIERLLNQIERVESLRVHVKIASGYKSEVLKNFVEKLNINLSIEFIENVDFDTTNNMYSLHLVLKALKEDNDIIIINADCFYEDSIVEDIMLSSGNHIAIDKTNFSEESMKVMTTNEGRIIGMSKGFEEDSNNFVSIDIYGFDVNYKNKIFNISSTIINNGDLNSWTEVAIDVLAKDNRSNIRFLDMTGKKWMEIDNHEDLRKAEEIFR